VSTPRSGAPWLALLALLTVVNLLVPAPGLVWAAGACAAVFLAIEHRRIPRGIRRISVVLGCISVLIIVLTPVPWESLRRGVAIGSLLASLISAVTLLARASVRSEGSRVLATHLLGRGVRTRCASFALACQVFGGLLGLAGVSMLLDMAAQVDPADTERLPLFAAIMRSFSAATLWSPMFSNVSILLALYPGMTWFSMLPLCIGLAAATVMLGLLMDYWRLRKHAGAARKVAGDAGPLVRALMPMVASMGGFLLLVVVLAWWLRMPVAGAIVMMVPFAALGVNVLQAGRGPARVRRGWQELREDYGRLPMLAGEVTLFMAAGCGGTVIASAVPVEFTQAIAQVVAHSPVLACLALMTSVVLMSFMAVHPVLSVVLIATAFPPALLQLPVLPHLLSMLVGWSVSGCVSPFSMLSLMAARYAGVSVYTVSVRANHVFALLCMGTAAIALGLLAAGMRPGP